ncbi:MAG: hydrolase 2, exosortase A system-associated [Kiloniellaceae bacterium]
MAIQPILIQGPAGPLFAIHHPPAEGVAARGDFLSVPPFAEEMNQARRMAAVQARRLAHAGYGVLLLDLNGTGDSGGDFADGRWDGWLGDIAAGLDWLEGQGRPLAGLWGLRLGGLLAVEAARANPARIPRLLLWQPVTSGRTFLNQFLRLRVAAGLGGMGQRETTATLRAALAAGEVVEIAGYPIAPALAAAMEDADLAIPPPQACSVIWLDMVASADTPPPPASVRTIEAWRAAGAQVTHRSVVGEPFWAVQSWLEPVLVPALWEASLDLLSDDTP